MEQRQGLTQAEAGLFGAQAGLGFQRFDQANQAESQNQESILQGAQLAGIPLQMILGMRNINATAG